MKLMVLGVFNDLIPNAYTSEKGYLLGQLNWGYDVTIYTY